MAEEQRTVEIRVPFPPSINHYYEPHKIGNRAAVGIGKKGKAYRQEILAVLIEKFGLRVTGIGRRDRGMIGHELDDKGKPIDEYGNRIVEGWNAILTGRLEVSIVFRAPCKRKRDLDNFIKALFDAFTKANLWQDDSLVDKLTIERGEVFTGGFLDVTIIERPEPDLGGLFAGD